VEAVEEDAPIIWQSVIEYSWTASLMIRDVNNKEGKILHAVADVADSCYGGVVVSLGINGMLTNMNVLVVKSQNLTCDRFCLVRFVGMPYFSRYII
jgi:hypothetical protein